MREDRDIEDRAPIPAEPGWSERLWAIGGALRRIAETRLAILREELAAKGALLGRGLAGLFIAVLFGAIAGLLATALVVVLLAKLFGSLLLGVLVTLVLVVAAAAAGGAVAVRSLSRLEPFEFPETRSEIDRDLETLRRATGSRQEDARPAPAGGGKSAGAPDSAEEMEARLREGAG